MEYTIEYIIEYMIEYTINFTIKYIIDYTIKQMKQLSVFSLISYDGWWKKENK